MPDVKMARFLYHKPPSLQLAAVDCLEQGERRTFLHETEDWDGKGATDHEEGSVTEEIISSVSDFGVQDGKLLPRIAIGTLDQIII